ncbi:beta-lactamase hydrolase domain-containing protein [Lysobacter brunescens]|uniref:Beta-lactamase hydrolase domain-containing protein n=1 Tax=Lysobacter brunescens TaxID=262323 RepID=A0ABW2YAB3_9GAMM
MNPVSSHVFRRSIRLLPVAALSMALAACAGHATQVLPAMTTTPAGTAVKQPAPQLYVAGQPAEADWRAFAAAGVGTVINLRTTGEMKGRDARAEVAAAGMRYLELPIDGAAAVTPENARRLGELLRDARGPVLVHCASGNRVGGLLALLKASEGMPAEQALDFGRSAGMTSTEAKVRDTLGVAPAAQAAP